MKLEVGQKVLAKNGRALFEGTIEEIDASGLISIRPIRCVKGKDMQLDMSIQLQCLLSMKAKQIVEVL